MPGQSSKVGIAYLMGAGPGDLRLLTVRAREVMARADLVVYDFLANERLLSLAPVRARKVYVGKRSGTHTLSQAEINALLVREVARGRTVVRLKGGDPFLFGRGGEEGAALAAAELRFEIIPGITSALAVPAYAGIPVTERDHSATLAIVTGHEHTGKNASAVNYAALAKMGTVVFLMGMAKLSENLTRLRKAGVPAGRPAAAIQWGTRPQQRTVVGTVGDLAARVRDAGLGSPAIVIVGEVVRLRPALNWFEGRPWFGKRIVFTRAREARENAELLEQLEHQGAEVVEVPTIAIESPVDFASLDRGIRSLGKYDWVVFTSPNGVVHFWDRLRHHGLDARALGNVRLATVGPATGKVLESYGLVPDLVPPHFRSAAFAAAFAAHSTGRIKVGEGLRGKRFLLVRAEEGSEDFPVEARRAGARVDLAIAYRTVPAKRPKGLALVEESGRIPDLIMFASSSAVRAFTGMLKRTEKKTLRGAPVACIGPVTAATARECGFDVVVLPARSTLAALVESMEKYFEDLEKGKGG
jgi:uroporphyrinogen III methyltransferase / synthase